MQLKMHASLTSLTKTPHTTSQAQIHTESS